jgi:hypothetical protein
MSLRKLTSLSTMIIHSKRVMRCLVIWSIVALVSIDVSTAMWSPYNMHPSNGNHITNDDATLTHHTYTQDHAYINVHNTLRGGSTILQPPPPPPLEGEHQQQQQRQESSTQPLVQQQQQHQQLQQMHQQQTHHHHYPPADRFGETAAPAALVPKIDLKQVTRALLHTSEFNRKLSQGVKHWGRQHKNQQNQQQQLQQQQSLPSFGNHQNQHHQTFDAHGYGNIPVNVHPSRTWQPPIEAFSGRDLEEEELTLFHAKIPRIRAETESGETVETQSEEQDRDRGADYWGPDLLPYLEHIAEILHMDNSDGGVELLLAMIYLDRACSVETPRSNGVPPCPFCGPRTVHRLGLAALVVSKRAVNVNSSRSEHGDYESDEELVSRLSLSLGIPRLQLQQMVEWMVAALGDDGLYVGLEDMRTWSRTWESFVSNNHSDN